MKQNSMFGVWCAGWLCVACGSSGEDSGGAVAASALEGTIEGTAFKAQSAIGSYYGSDGTMSISIYDTAVNCETRPPEAARYILLSVPWKANSQRDFSLKFDDDGQTATFVIDAGGKTNNILATEGRVEILDAPVEVGLEGTIRLRAIARENEVEGAIQVRICRTPDF